MLVLIVAICLGRGNLSLHTESEGCKDIFLKKEMKKNLTRRNKIEEENINEIKKGY